MEEKRSILLYENGKKDDKRVFYRTVQSRLDNFRKKNHHVL